MKTISKLTTVVGWLLISTTALGNQASTPSQNLAAASPGTEAKSAAQANPPVANNPAAEQVPAAENSCGPAACHPRMVERTVLVPIPVRETRKVECVEYSTEERQQTVTVMHIVPEKQTVTRDYLVMTPEKRTRTENYTVCKPVPSATGCGSCQVVPQQRQRVVEYTVCVPQKKTCSYEVTVCKYVPEQKNVSVSICVPHPVEKEVEVCAYRLTPKTILVPLPCCPPPCCYGCCYGPSCGWNTWCW